MRFALFRTPDLLISKKEAEIPDRDLEGLFDRRKLLCNLLLLLFLSLFSCCSQQQLGTSAPLPGVRN